MYRWFVPGCAHILQPLHRLLAKSSQGNQHFTWNPEAAITQVKDALADATLLVHPQAEASACLITDASDNAVGISPMETRYSTFELVLLAVYLATRHYRHPVPACRWMLFTLVTGRPSTSPEWVKCNKRNQSCRMPRIPRSSCAWFTYPLWMHATLLCDMSTGTSQPYVPQPFRQAAFHALHFLSHPGIRATQRLVTARYVWPRINADVRQWARSCLQCQRTKLQRQTITSPGTFALPDARFDHVHIDLVGTLPPFKGTYSYLLTCVDKFTRWPEDIMAPTVAQVFVSGWVAHFGTTLLPTGL